MRYLKHFENKEETSLCDIDIDWARKHFDSSFGDFEAHLDPDRGGIDRNISKCLKINNEIIGCYCLSTFSINECADRIKWWTENEDKLYTNLEFFFPEKSLKIFKNKVGIFGDYLFIDPPYRNKGRRFFL